MLCIASCLTKIFIKNYAIGNSTKNNMLLNINLGNRHCRRVRLRFRSAQDDTKGSEAVDFNKKQSLRHAIACHLPLHKGGGSDICIKQI